jgi:hypothetical protein
MKKVYTLLFTSLSLGSFAQVGSRTAAAFTPGNVVVYRVGDSSAALSSAATAAFLDEYTPAGVRVQSIALPTTVNGANRRVTASGTATSEGLITRSTDGRFLLATGYDTTVGAASITTIAGSTLKRTVAVVDNAGNINSTTALADFASGSNPRGAASTDGVNLWLTGGAGGVRYATLGATSSTAVTSDITNLRAVHIFNGQLYVSTASGSAVRVGTVGTGLPTTAGQTTTNLPGFPTTTSPYQFFFADLNPAIPGVDVLYVADDAAATGIQKYSYTGSTWVANGNLVPTPSGTRGLTGVVTGTTVTLYTTTISNLYALVDASGYNNNITGAFSSIASAPTNTAFRGVALVPTATALPLTITSFNASFNGAATQLKWTSANEVNVKGYSIEKSVNGTAFTEVSFVSARNIVGENTYTWTDNSMASGATYYRIKTTDKDGSLKYSQVVVINSRAGISASVFPNPAISSLTVNHTSAMLGAKLSVLTLEGKLIKSLAVQQGAVQTAVSVSELLKGNYLLIYQNNGEKTVTKFSKQ